jgi:lysozyme
MHQQLYTGCVENRNDPLKLGRCQVRVVGLHHHDKTILKTADLPWAFPMQPVTSAAMSGLGHAPVGLVEGTWVIVMFRDEDEQQPIILGSLGGIPQAQTPVDKDDDSLILKQDGYLPLDQQQVVQNAAGNNASNTTATPAAPEATGLATASSYSPSQDAINLIKRFEGKRLTSYQDSIGKWTIGYGTTTINGAPVTQGMTITDAQADQYLMDHVTTAVAPSVKGVKAPITQSMFDAMCCLTYNIGSGNFGGSTLKQNVNVTKYLDAATNFLDWNKAGGKVLAGLTTRRAAEKDLFLKDGIPNVAGDLTPTQSATPVGTVAPATSAPSTGLANGGAATVLGFNDPNGKYPLYLNEPDTNKLARHEDIKKTIVYKKELAREKGVVTAGGKTWDQSKIPYNSDYPFNKVFMGESGHVMEFDDTPHKERVHIYHKAGTFTEIDANGTQVNRIDGDNYEILERNGFVYIKGALNITIDGDHNVKVNNALNVDVSGKTTINVFNDAIMNISGNYDLSVKENFNIRAKSINLETYDFGNFNVKSAGAVNVQSDFAQNFKAGATFNVDSVRTDLNSGTAGDAQATGLETPKDKLEPTEPVFDPLIVLTRGADAAGQYETPEDGDPTAYIQGKINDGTIPADEIGSGTAQASVAAPANAVQPTGANCDVIYGMQSFTPDLQLSPHFILGALTKGGTRTIKAQMGLTPQEIVCNLKGLAENCLEKVINLYPSMIITSGFRSPGDVANSSATSRHYYGEAADIQIPGYDRAKMYEAIQAIQQIIPYDQLILEYSGSTTCWIHCSFKYTGNRKMAFTMRDNKTYAQGYTLIA